MSREGDILWSPWYSKRRFHAELAKSEQMRYYSKKRNEPCHSLSHDHDGSEFDRVNRSQVRKHARGGGEMKHR